MPETHMRRRVMHSPEDLLKFVADVEGYPKFINLLSALRVTDRRFSENIESFKAEATVSYKFISERFKSSVRVDHDNLRITVDKDGRGGAVKSLNNTWDFKTLSDGSTLVDFYVSVSLKAFPLNMLLRDKFDKAGDHIMNLFIVRASQFLEKVGDPDLDWQSECA